jgi:hypothetical protein
MKIEVFVRTVYGAPNIYPANPAAEIAAELVGKKTFSRRDLELLKKLGHEVAQVLDPKTITI